MNGTTECYESGPDEADNRKEFYVLCFFWLVYMPILGLLSLIVCPFLWLFGYYKHEQSDLQ